MLLSSLRRAFGSHKSAAKRRSIAFLLSFDEWLNIWTSSGHIDKRGRRRGEYQMARFGDKGPYAIGNVEIVLAEINLSAATKGKKLGPFTQKHRNNLAKAARKRSHKPHSEETKRKIAEALKNRTRSPEHCAAISASKLGKKPNFKPEHLKQQSLLLIARNKSPEMRAKVSASLKGKDYWKKRQRDKFGHFI